MNEQQFRELSAARALRALSLEDEQAFSEALAAHPEWQSVVDADRETAANLGAGTAEVAPPAAARAAILDLISRTLQFDVPEPTRLRESDAPDPQTNAHPAAAPRPTPPEHAADPGIHPSVENAEAAGGAENSEDLEADHTRARRRAGWFVLAASVAVLLIATLALPLRGMLTPQDPVTVALQQVEAAADARTATVGFAGGGEATLHWSDSVQQAVLVAEGMQAAPAERDYELWIVRGEQPLSLGVMHADEDGGAAVLAPGFEPGDTLAVTVEDRGGSPTGLPTTDPIVVIATA